MNRLTLATKLKLLICTVLLTASFSGRAAFISLETSNASVEVGDSINIDIWIRDLGSEFVSAFDLNLTFNNALVQYANSAFGPFLGNGIDSIQSVIPGFGNVNLAEFTFLSDTETDALQRDPINRIDFVLANVSFTAEQVGVAGFEIDIDPIFGGIFMGDNGIPVNFTLPSAPLLVNITQSTTPVPEPNLFGLICSLFCVIALSRQQARSA